MSSDRLSATSQINIGYGIPLIMQPIQCSPMLFGKCKNTVFQELKTLLALFNIGRYYTDDWGAYERHIEAKKHEIGKRNTQKIERNNLNFRT